MREKKRVAYMGIEEKKKENPAEKKMFFSFPFFILHPSSLILSVFIFQPSCLPAGGHPFRRRRGQTTVEYLLMLATVASMSVIMVIFFHKKILGGIFTLAGMIIGAGTPK